MLANTITKKHLPAIIKTAVGKKNIHISALANMINKNKNNDLIPVPQTEITTINKKGLNLKPIVLKNQNKETNKSFIENIYDTFKIKKKDNKINVKKIELNENVKKTILNTLEETKLDEKIKKDTEEIFTKRNEDTNQKISKIRNFMNKINKILKFKNKISNMILGAILCYLVLILITLKLDDVINYITNVEKFLYTLKYTYKYRFEKITLEIKKKLYEDNQELYDEIINKLKIIEEKIDEIIKEKYYEEYYKNKINIIDTIKNKLEYLNWIYSKREISIKDIFKDYIIIKNNEIDDIKENDLKTIMNNEKNLNTNLSNTYLSIDGKIDEIKNIFNELFEDNNDLIEDRLKDNKNSKNMPTNNKELVKEYIKYGLILEREEELKIIGEELVEQMKKLKEQKLKINMIEEFPKKNKKEIEKLENLKLKLLKMNKDDKDYKKLEKEIENESIILKKNQELHGYYNENHIKATEFKENKKHYNVSNKQLNRLRKEYIKLLNKHIEEKKEVKTKLVRKEYDNMDKIKYIAFLYDKIVNKSELAKIDKDYINKTLKNKTYLNEDEYNYLALRISQNIVDEKIKSKSYFDWIPSINLGYFLSFSKATNNQIKQGVKYSFNDYRPDTIALILKTISDSNDINKFNEKDIANILKLQRIKDLMEGKTDKILLDNLKFDEKGLLYENYVKKSINFLFGYDKNKEKKYLSRDEATKYILNTEYPRVVKKYYFKDKDIIRQTNGFINYFYKCIRYFDKGISKYFTNYIKTEKIDKKEVVNMLNELKMKKYPNNYDIINIMKKYDIK
jgi:hypothetical protein